MAAESGSGRVGLARALSKLGFCSRSRAVALVRAGRVALNGATPHKPETPGRVRPEPGAGRVGVGGAPVGRQPALYWMMNKPRGLVTTARDDEGRETVYSRLPPGL